MPDLIPHTPFLDPEHVALVQRVAEFCKQEVEADAAEKGDGNTHALDFLARLAAGELLRYVIPQQHGGMHPRLDIRSLCLIRRGLARHSSLADTMFAMQGLGSYPITLAGSDDLRTKFLPAVASGKAIAAFALTEPEAGSDAAGISTTAQRVGSDYIVNGTKTFISNAGVADFYVVFVKTDPALGRKGMSAIVIETDRPGFRVVRQMELIAPHPIGEIRMEQCSVPAKHRLGAEGEGYAIMLRTLECFRTTVGAAALGMAERALKEATAYARRRVQFGKPLSEFQGLRFMLSEMATELEAARLLVLSAAWKLDCARQSSSSTEPPSASGDPDLVMSSSMAKLYATEAAQKVIDMALQIHGGIGVVKGSVVERLYREIRALRVYEGTSEIQKEIISHQLLKS